MILGSKLRAVRRSRGKTMQEIASAAGLSVGFVSQVERGIAVPSISSLRKLAAALEQPVGNFLEVSSQSSQLTRSSERLPFTLGQNALTYERLSHSFGGSKLTALLIHEPPGHRTEPVSHEGEELQRRPSASPFTCIAQGARRGPARGAAARARGVRGRVRRGR